MIERLRKICLALPEAVETTNFGHPFFRFKKKPFCVFHGKEDEPAIAFKVLKSEAGIFLEDPRFFKTPYMHHNGWISLRAEGKLDWKEVAELVKGSYDLTGAKKRQVIRVPPSSRSLKSLTAQPRFHTGSDGRGYVLT